MSAYFPYIARVYVSHVFCILQFAIYCRHYKIDLAPLRGPMFKVGKQVSGSMFCNFFLISVCWPLVSRQVYCAATHRPSPASVYCV